MHLLMWFLIQFVKKLVRRAQDWHRSSVHAHLDGITTIKAAIDRIGNFKTFLKGKFNDGSFQVLRGSEYTGRPIGDDEFIEILERSFDRKLRPQNRGPKVVKDK